MNLEKAVRAASDRRRLGSPTEAEKEAWRQNLLRARQVLHDDHTYKYATCFRHGLTALSLERSLVLAGESLEEYQAHLARFDRLVQGLKPGPQSDPAKLARATALVAWRRLRALRLDREWTLRALVDCLHQAIGARERAREQARQEGKDHSGSLATGSSGLATQFAGLAGALAPDGLGYLDPDALISLGLGLEAASSNWIGTWRSLTRLSNRFDQLWCKLVEELGEPRPFLSPSIWWERVRMRPSPIVENYPNWPVEVLGNPLLRPSQILARLAEHGLEVQPVDGWHCHPLFRTLEEADNYRWQEGERRREAERERLEEGRITVAGDSNYRLLGRARQAELEGRERPEPGIHVKDACHSEPVRSSAVNGSFALLRTGSERSAEAPGKLREESRSRSGEALPMPSSFEEFLELVERAFGPEPPPGSFGLGVLPGEDGTTPGPSSTEEGESAKVDKASAAGSSPSPGEAPRSPAGSSAPPSHPNQPFPAYPSPSSVEEGPGVVLPSSPAGGGNPQEPADDTGRVRRLAELLWERVQRVRERAEEEARRLAQFVDAYGDALGRPQPEAQEALSTGSCVVGRREESATGAADQVEQRDRRASEILQIFRDRKSGKLRSGGRERRIRLQIYDLAVGRFGKQEDFDLLKRPHDRFDQLHQEFFEAFFSQFHQAAPDAGSG